MFRAALAKVSKYTFPVIISRRAASGRCSSSIGAYIILNKEGWIVTAGHIIRQWHELLETVERVNGLQAARSEIEKDQSLTRKERAAKLTNIVIGKDDSDRCSAWWGVDGVQLKDFSYFSAVVPDFGDAIDLGVGRLEPFDPTVIKEYAVFKNPNKNFEPGVSLCKLGFPFYEVTPIWNEQSGGFVLPPGTLPMPRFPIEGMFTRISEIVINDGKPIFPFPVLYVETSSPGLRGQSGGPTFDTDGNIWAIQAKTIT